MMQSGAKTSAMSVNFQSMRTCSTSMTEDGAGFLDQIGQAELEEVVERGAVGLDAVDEFAGGVPWKKSSESELTLRKASYFTSLVMRWPLQAMQVAAAIAEQAAQENGERDEQKAAQALLPVQRPALERQPGVDGHIEFLLGSAVSSWLSSEWTAGRFRRRPFALLHRAALLRDVLQHGRDHRGG